MATEIPIVRHFLACRDLSVDASNRVVALGELVHSVVRLPGESFPVRQRLALYALLTNGRGEHDIAIELTLLDRGEEATEAVERTLRTALVGRIDLGQDPTLVHGLPFSAVTVDFLEAGQYAFAYLLCNGQRIGQEYLDVR